MLQPGSDSVRELFLSSTSGARVNHGSYGLAPESVRAKRFELLKEQEEQPDVWFRVNLAKYYEESVKAAAAFVRANPQNVFIVDNATTGTNAVLKSLKLGAASEILLTNYTYRAVQNTVSEIEEYYGFTKRSMQLPEVIQSEDEIVELYENYLSNNPNIKIVIIDHITSPSAVLLPVQKIVELCKKHNVISFIDGAHAPGQVDLHVEKIGADFYVGNFHKWCYASRGCAFLWISSDYLSKIRPMITSNHLQTLHFRFGYMGTRDYSSFYTLPEAFKFYENLGGLRSITGYAEEILNWAEAMLCQALNTKPLCVPNSMKAPCMRVIGLPKWPENIESMAGDKLIVVLWLKYSVQVAFPEFHGKMWLRISANVYNKKEDYTKLRDALLDFYQLN